MHAGLVQPEPDDDREHRVQRPAAGRHEPDERDEPERDQCHEQRRDVQLVGVEDGDGGERTDVVDDGERQQEDAQP